MRGGQRIAVVVPAYNEAKLIVATLRSIPAFVDRIVVVDDASTDATAAQVASEVCRDGRVLLRRHARNQGVGAALKTGYRSALADGAEVVVVMAGDGQMDPADLPALLTPVLEGRADYAKGNRLAHPSVRRAMPPARLLGNRALSWMTRLALGVRVRDSQCGYTAASRGALTGIALGSLWEGYGYPNDLLAQLSAAGMRVADVPVRPVYGDEVSGIRLRHALAVIPFVIARALLRRGLLSLRARPRWRAAPAEFE